MLEQVWLMWVHFFAQNAKKVLTVGLVDRTVKV